METRRLSYFVRIAEDGSLTKASGVLRIAQPALSRQIRLLEEDLGISLFSRTARGMQLTEAGEHLRAAVAGPLRELELALQNIRSFTSSIEGNIAIGLPPSVNEFVARPLALRMDADHPNIKLLLVEGYTGSLMDWLNRGIVDFALLEESSRDERLIDRKLSTEPLLLVGTVDSSLSMNQPIKFKDVAQLPLIIQSHHLGIRSTLNDAVAAVGATLNIRFQADSPRLIKELVLSGKGYAILPMSCFKEEYSQDRLLCCPIIDPNLSLTLFLSSRKNSQTNRLSRHNLEQVVFDYVLELVEQNTIPTFAI